MVKKSKIIRITAFAVCLSMLLWLSACGEGSTKVIFTTGFGKDEVFRIENTVCRKPELMIYLTTTQQQYEEVYGPQVWSIQKDGITLEENVKESVLARLAQVKTMSLLAQEKGVELDQQELEWGKAASEEYLAGLKPAQAELLQVDLETVEMMYRDYALSHKLYRQIIRDVNPEISDDEARIITVQTIFLRTSAVDAQGERRSCSEQEKQEIRNNAAAIREALLEGEDFLEMASKYGDNETITWSFGKNEADPALEQVAFLLETNEISPVIETEDGYYILKCVTTLNREETDANKTEIVEQRRKQVFGVEYDRFTQQLARQLNTRLWDEIEMVHGEELPQVHFFEIYEKYFLGAE